MRVRAIEAADLPAVVDLCAEHAAFEGAVYSCKEKVERLREALDQRDVLFGWIAEWSGELVGYATATIDFSTWKAATFMHLDCLYIKASARGRGVGRSLFAAVIEEARQLDIDEIQWQTPEWNLQADKFYRRFGPAVTRKLRYALPLSTTMPSTAGYRVTMS